MKTIFKDENEKRAAILTVMTMFLLFLWMFFQTAGTYQDPPEEYGMEVNFGTTDTGQGDNQSTEPIKMQPNTPVTAEQPVDEPVEETPPVEEAVEAPTESAQEDVITEDTTEDVPVVETSETPVDTPVEEVTPVETPVDTPVEPVETTKPTETPVEETPTETPVETTSAPAPPQPDASTENALLNVLNGPPADGTSSNSEGDGNENGDMGNENGDPNAPDYYTNPGNGSGGNYDLIGRLPLRRPLPAYLCQKEGRVVVSIKVNRDGKVISATPGAKGSTTTEQCLLDQAKIAAMKTKWQSAANAPEKQVGKIIYNFSLR